MIEDETFAVDISFDRTELFPIIADVDMEPSTDNVLDWNKGVDMMVGDDVERDTVVDGYKG
jgi:hypothetical protein